MEMKYCPNCGDVYPEQAAVCQAHGTVLHTWGGGTDVGDITHTDVVALPDELPFHPGDAFSGSRSMPIRHEHTAPPRTPSASVVVDPSLGYGPPVTNRVLGGRYHLHDQIGIGGYGAVFRAVDDQTAVRVAVKILSPALSNDYEVLERFRREAIAASMVRHPGIVEVFDVGVDATGLHFIVMEFLDGVDLQGLLRDGVAMERARALGIALQCAHALTAAHDAGILHRDLKPANIFVTRAAHGGDAVKIIDFGVSKITRRVDVGADLTSASKVVGTPMYMAPEQARGAELDGRVDVYALGIILYVMLTGTPPFTGASALEILEKHARQKRVPPSHLNPELFSHAAIDRAVLAAIAVKPDDRHASMAAFAAALTDCLDAVQAITPTVPRDLRRTAGDDTLVVAPLPLPLQAPAQGVAASGEATRVMRASPGHQRPVVYALISTTVVAIAALVWLATADRSGEGGRDRPAATELTATPEPDGDVPRAASAVPRPAADASVPEAEGIADQPGGDARTATQEPKRERPPPRRVKRRPAREEPLGIEEW